MSYAVLFTCEARQEGIEPPTWSLEGSRSIHLSYWRRITTFAQHVSLPTPRLPEFSNGSNRALWNTNRGGRIRTGGLLLPKQARYRATLRPALPFAHALRQKLFRTRIGS